MDAFAWFWLSLAAAISLAVWLFTPRRRAKAFPEVTLSDRLPVLSLLPTASVPLGVERLDGEPQVLRLRPPSPPPSERARAAARRDR